MYIYIYIIVEHLLLEEQVSFGKGAEYAFLGLLPVFWLVALVRPLLEMTYLSYKMVFWGYIYNIYITFP